MTVAKRIVGVVVALLLMAAAWDDCAEIPGESSFDDETLTEFTDVTKDHRLYVGIRIAENEGWFKGYGDGTLRPDETITAAQIAKVVDRLYPDGATRAEVANFLAAGSIGVLQKNLVVEVNQDNRTVTVSNLGSYPVDLHGYELSWQAASGDEQSGDEQGGEHIFEAVTIEPGGVHTVEVDAPPTNATLNNPYVLQIAASS